MSDFEDFERDFDYGNQDRSTTTQAVEPTSARSEVNALVYTLIVEVTVFANDDGTFSYSGGDVLDLVDDLIDSDDIDIDARLVDVVAI